ncbi:MAG: hypothetical protein JRJ03_08775 [Deltaproteobacteria bacterium]|nr:hypothetical protein [Deltaproteobacteria bacterium]
MKIKVDDREVEMTRVVAGLGWPAEKPGFLVVVGEELFFEPPFPKTGVEFRYHVIAESEQTDLSKLIKTATASKNRFEIQTYYARLKSSKSKELPALHYLEQHNRTAFAQGVAPLYVVEAPFAEDRGLLSFHLNVVKGLLRPEKRTLFIPPTSALNAALLEVPDDVSRVKDVDFPAVAALGYAVAALVTWRQEADNEWQMERLLDEVHGDL